MATRKENRSDESGSSAETDKTTQTAATSVSPASPSRGDDTKSTDTAGFLPLLVPPTAEEAVCYYKGIPSWPRLIGRTSAGIVPWTLHCLDPYEAHLQYREMVMSPPNHTRMRIVWPTAEPQIRAVVDRLLPYTSIDVWRIGGNDLPTRQRPVIVWIGIEREKAESGSVPWNDVAQALRECRQILDSVGLEDVHCEIRGSDVFMLAGQDPQPVPAVLPPLQYNKLAYAAQPFSTAVGQSTFPTNHTNIYGTLGLFLRPANPDDKRLWAITCRHVAIPTSADQDNALYQCGGTKLADSRLQMASPRDADVVRSKASIDDILHRIPKLLEKEDLEANRQYYEAQLNAAVLLQPTISLFESTRARVLGHVCLAPPIGPGDGWPSPWTRDYALIELDTRDKFPTNVVNQVDLRIYGENRMSLEKELNPNAQNKFFFEYPPGGLLRLSGIIPRKEMLNPTMIDKDGEECLIVGMHGAASGLSWGRPSDIKSTVRFCLPNGGSFVSSEWAVEGSLADKYQPFSRPGDSGAAVFDTQGRVGGILTRGTGNNQQARVDVSYVTPMQMLLPDIERMLGTEVVLV